MTFLDKNGMPVDGDGDTGIDPATAKAALNDYILMHPQSGGGTGQGAEIGAGGDALPFVDKGGWIAGGGPVDHDGIPSVTLDKSLILDPNGDLIHTDGEHDGDGLDFGIFTQPDVHFKNADQVSYQPKGLKVWEDTHNPDGTTHAPPAKEQTFGEWWDSLFDWGAYVDPDAAPGNAPDPLAELGKLMAKSGDIPGGLGFDVDLINAVTGGKQTDAPSGPMGILGTGESDHFEFGKSDGTTAPHGVDSLAGLMAQFGLADMTGAGSQQDLFDMMKALIEKWHDDLPVVHLDEDDKPIHIKLPDFL